MLKYLEKKRIWVKISEMRMTGQLIGTKKNFL
jgi:hypothetical protein